MSPPGRPGIRQGATEAAANGGSLRGAGAGAGAPAGRLLSLVLKVRLAPSSLRGLLRGRQTQEAAGASGPRTGQPARCAQDLPKPSCPGAQGHQRRLLREPDLDRQEEKRGSDLPGTDAPAQPTHSPPAPVTPAPPLSDGAALTPGGELGKLFHLPARSPALPPSLQVCPLSAYSALLKPREGGGAGGPIGEADPGPSPRPRAGTPLSIHAGETLLSPGGGWRCFSPAAASPDVHLENLGAASATRPDLGRGRRCLFGSTSGRWGGNWPAYEVHPVSLLSPPEGEMQMFPGTCTSSVSLPPAGWCAFPPSAWDPGSAAAAFRQSSVHTGRRTRVVKAGGAPGAPTLAGWKRMSRSHALQRAPGPTAHLPLPSTTTVYS